MYRWAFCALLGVAGTVAAHADEDSERLLSRIRSKMAGNLNALPDYTCMQIIERFRRAPGTRQFEPLDRLRLEVGLIGNREMFAWPEARKFEEKDLADMVGNGTVGTGYFALFAKTIFDTNAPEITFAGEVAMDGKRAFRFEYEVPRNRSPYVIRVRPHQAVVGFHGSFWAEVTSLEVLRLEVHADDIPPELGMAHAASTIDYGRVALEKAGFLLPQSAELMLTGVGGEVNLNRSQFSGCRQYLGESTVSFDRSSEDVRAPKAQGSRLVLRSGLAMDLSLDSDIAPETAVVGETIRAVLARPVKDGDRVVVPEGTSVVGRLVRLEKSALPFEHYVVAMQFYAIESGGARADFVATLEDAGPASGLIREAKRMNPTFTRKRSARLEILVREQHRGEGVIHWDAKKQRIPRGLRMRWQVDSVQE